MADATDAATVKRAQRALYEAGEYHALSAVLEPVAAVLVRAAGVSAGDTVLDVAAGDGNVALAAWRVGARVIATDLSPVQVERGRARCTRVGADVRWQVADAEALPFGDGEFDHVVSAFGAVFAPSHEIATTELARVCRPGGTVALTAWPPDSLVGESAATARRLCGTAAPFPDLELGWGDRATATARLEVHGEVLTCERRVLVWDAARRGAAGTRDCAVAFLGVHLNESDLAALRAARDEIAARHTDPAGVTRAEYLLAVARVR